MSKTPEQIERDLILSGLGPLKEEAREKGLWLWCNYQDLWFSPDELDAQNAKGSFIWGAVNWKLRDPKEMVAEADQRLDAAQRDRDRIAAKLAEARS